MPAEPKRVEALFHRALDLSPDDRAAFLAAECGADAELRERVERLLAAHTELGTFLNPLIPVAPSTADFAGDPEGTAAHAPCPDSGTVIAGRYKLVEEIGEGGMGSVWMAQQTEPVKRFVAVKLIKAGMDSKAVLARFDAERQALAMMDHPNIAKVLDAGATSDGRPFFIMELVRGVPITKYCDERKLTPRERLELFVPVCQAIQHAHQKGIIHRDIKPNNVLVALYDDRPVPKVIDFGVAKAAGQPLTDKTLATGFGAVVGTPEYMSPEQASFNNLDIDTRSDVYALGVLLYELLAGAPAVARKEMERIGLLEIFRVIREQEPPKPSTKLSTADALPTLSANRGTEPKKLTRLLRGELDWIVMKALEKDRTRRYETANGFAADVQRYLAGEPVQAVPPSAGYRLKKFLWKNRAAVVTSGLFLALLVAGVVVSTVFGFQATRNADRARKNETIANDNAGRADANAKTARENETLAKAETQRVRGMLYTANFGRIQDALRERRISRVRQLLAETKPGPGETDLRGFEWHYVDRLVNSHKDVVTLHHWDSWNEIALVTTPAMSCDGRWASIINWGGGVEADPIEEKGDAFASQVGENELTVWDLTTGKVVSTIERRTAINYLCHQIIASSGFVAFGSKRTVTIYDPMTKAEKGSITVEGHLSCICFDHTGQRMAALTQIRDPKTPPGKRIFPIDHLWQVEVWDMARKERIQLIERESGWLLHEIALTPDGSRIVIDYALPVDNPTGMLGREELERRSEHKIVVREVNGRKPAFEFTLGNSTLPSSGAFSHDSRMLAVVRGRLVHLYDVQTGKPRRTYGPIDAVATAVAHSPDGRTLAVGDESAGITLFDVVTGEAIEKFVGHEQPIAMVAFRGNDSLVSNCKAGRVKEWSPGQSQRAVFTDLGPGRGGLTVDPTYRYALTSPRVVPPTESSVAMEATLWDTSSGEPRQLFRKPLSLPDSQSPAGVQNSLFSPDGRRVVVTYQQAPKGRQYQIFPVPWNIDHLLPTPVDWFGGVMRASYGWASQIPGLARTVVWDVSSGEVVLDLPQLTSSPKFSRDGRFLTMYHQQDNRINPTAADRRVWDLSVRPARCVSLEAPAIPLADQERIEETEVFGPGDRYLTMIARKVRRTPPGPATTGTYLLRWDLQTGRLVFSRPFPDAPAGRHVFGRFLFSPDLTRIVRLPNSEDGQPVHSEKKDIHMWELRPDGEAVRIWTDSGDWITGEDEGLKSSVTQLRAEFTPDGKRLVFVAERQARIYNLDGMDRPLILRGVRGFPALAALSDDGRRLVMLSNNSPLGSTELPELKVWDLASGQELLATPLSRLPQYSNSFLRTFDGKQQRMFVRSQRGGEFITLDGSPREEKR